MNVWDIVLAVGIAAVVALAAAKLIRDRRQGKGSCGCNCANCPSKCEGRKSN